VKRDARLVLPGEYVLLQDPRKALKVHHVETVGFRPEVILCFSAGPHPNREVEPDASWPTVAVNPGTEVEVVPDPPRIPTPTWDQKVGQWRINMPTADGTWFV
jgi:hypothetical protein